MLKSTVIYESFDKHDLELHCRWFEYANIFFLRVTFFYFSSWTNRRMARVGRRREKKANHAKRGGSWNLKEVES